LGDGFQKLRRLAEKIQGTPSFRETISYDCLIKVAFEWVIKRYRHETIVALCDYLIPECTRQLKDMEIWNPVYQVYAEEDLNLGSCLFRTITAAMLDERERDFRCKTGEIGPQIDKKFRAERKRMQATLAATFRLYAEPGRGYEIPQE
jgi:hypothetical protein